MESVEKQYRKDVEATETPDDSIDLDLDVASRARRR